MVMNVFVETLRGLYLKKMINKAKVDEFLTDKKITVEEHLYILRKDGE